MSERKFGSKSPEAHGVATAAEGSTNPQETSKTKPLSGLEQIRRARQTINMLKGVSEAGKLAHKINVVIRIAERNQSSIFLGGIEEKVEKIIELCNDTSSVEPNSRAHPANRAIQSLVEDLRNYVVANGTTEEKNAFKFEEFASDFYNEPDKNSST